MPPTVRLGARVHQPGLDDAFIRNSQEFAHQHPPQDGSVHLTLPDDTKKLVTEAGWDIPHPIQNTELVFGPRDRDEIEGGLADPPRLLRLRPGPLSHRTGPSPGTSRAPTDTHFKEFNR